LQSSKNTRLEETLAAIRTQWGRNAIAPLTQTRSPTLLATGFVVLDDLLGGGLPQGRLVEFCGVGTSGAQTLALHIAAAAQRRHENVAYLDVAHTLEASVARGCGVDLGALLRVCPSDGKQALAIAYTLLDRAAVNLLIVDSLPALLGQKGGGSLLASALPQLLPPLSKSRAVVVLLSTPTSGERITTHAAVRLLVARQEWLERRDDTHGYRVVVTILKNNSGRSGQHTTLDLSFNQHDDDSL
jgi:recombination protein RecA